jgi:hypothetical protein
VVRYLKFRELLAIEPSDCRISAKTNKIKINGKEQDFETGFTTSFSTYLKGGLDVGNNWRGNIVNKVELGGQVTQALYEVDIRQELAKANDLTGTLKLDETLRAPTTDRAVVDSREGTFVWDYTQDACPDTIVKLYVGPIKVLTNSTTSFTDGTAIVLGRDKTRWQDWSLMTLSFGAGQRHKKRT